MVAVACPWTFDHSRSPFHVNLSHCTIFFYQTIHCQYSHNWLMRMRSIYLQVFNEQHILKIWHSWSRYSTFSQYSSFFPIPKCYSPTWHFSKWRKPCFISCHMPWVKLPDIRISSQVVKATRHFTSSFWESSSSNLHLEKKQKVIFFLPKQFHLSSWGWHRN